MKGWKVDMFRFMRHKSKCLDVAEQIDVPDQTKNIQQAEAAGTSDLTALVTMGDQANAAGSWGDARDAYAEALSLDPNLDAIWVQYGHSLKELGHLDEAEKAYREAINLTPNSSEPFLQLGHLYKIKRQPGLAAGCYRRAFELDPRCDDARLSFNRLAASFYLNSGIEPKSIFVEGTSATEEACIVGREFDIEFYLEQAGPLQKEVDPVEHYNEVGWKLGHDPCVSFSTKAYLELCDEVRGSGINPYFHYLKFGRREGRPGRQDMVQPLSVPYVGDAALVAAELDRGFYYQNYPEVRASGGDPVLHYMTTGWMLGYDPSPSFSTRLYLELSPDVAGGGECPFVHFLKCGRSLGRIAKLPAELAVPHLDLRFSQAVKETVAPHFDEKFYSSRYADMTNSGLDFLEHYLLCGSDEGRDPTPWFSTRHYLERYPEIRIQNINPFFHYLIWGQANGFSPHAPSNGGTPSRFVPKSQLVKQADLRTFLWAGSSSPPLATGTYDAERLNIHWVVPDFERGGGGHMTIFRMVKWLEVFGHSCTVWVANPGAHRTDSERLEIVLRHYQAVRADIRSLSAEPAFIDADAVIATSWDTAYVVAGAAQAKSRYYFVQDYEPYFHPIGSNSIAALKTYELDLACICASGWLKMLMRDKHGRWARSFYLAADERYCKPTDRKSNPVPRIAFYSRDFTSRRAVELGLLALELLAARNVSFEVDFFGSERLIEETPFPAVNWGVVDTSVLAKLYCQADVGVCFSATNYSLVPQEMMACGLPVVELDTESARAAYPKGVVALAGPSPQGIADVLEALVASQPKRADLTSAADEWLSTLSWERSARAVESAILERLEESESKPNKEPASIQGKVKASVIVPSYNGGKLFETVVRRVLEQRCSWNFELIVVDSESTDGTWEFLQSELLNDAHKRRLRAVRIPKVDFQHGRTRNFGASLAQGEYLVFITQDALPCDEFWLYNFVVLMDRYPSAACAFGRHMAWSNASAFTKRDLENHFKQFDEGPLICSKYTDPARWASEDVQWRQFLYYFSDNNACLRKTVWERHNYPEVDYGEDQTWAKEIITRGYGKIYAYHSAVSHSHDYDEVQTFVRARTEANFFARYFGYETVSKDVFHVIQQVNADDEVWGIRAGVSAEEINVRKRLNVHRLMGWGAGSIDGVTFPSAF